jgi:dihydrofolate reductase
MQADNQDVVFSGLRIFYTRHLCYNSVEKFNSLKTPKPCVSVSGDRRGCMDIKDMIIMVAMTAERVIGRRGHLPWNIPEDLALFRNMTLGHALIMGRRTFDSIGKPLPGRTNIVVSRSMKPVAGVIVCRDFSQAVERAKRLKGKVFFIGGYEIYRQALPVAGRMSVSWIKKDYAGDCRFPDYDHEDWSVEEQRDYPEFVHVVYRRKCTDVSLSKGPFGKSRLSGHDV